MAGTFHKRIHTRTSAVLAVAVVGIAVTVIAAASLTMVRHETFVVWCRNFLLANLGDFGGWGLAAIGVTGIATALLSLAGAWILSREAIRSFGLRRHLSQYGVIASGKAERAAASVGKVQVAVVADAQPYAFTSGLLYPKVFLSQGLVSMLSLAELRAVIRHEHCHVRHRHPLQSFLLGVTSRILFFIPTLRDIADHLALRREVEADRAASTDVSGRRALASALSKTMLVATGGVTSGFGVAHFSRVGPRVAALATEDDRVEVRLGIVRLVVSIAVVCTMFFAAVVAGGIADAHASTAGGMLACPAPEQVQDRCLEVSPFLKLDIEGPMSRALQSPYLRS